MVELYPGSCILVELCIGGLLFGRDVNVPAFTMRAPCRHFFIRETTKAK